MKLYELTDQYKQLQNLEDVPPEAIADTLESIEGEVEEKAQAIVSVWTGMESDITAIDNEIARLTARKKAIKAQDESLRNYLKHNMEAMGIKNIKCPLFAITLARGKEVVQVDDEDALPDEYVEVVVTTRPKKRELLADLKAKKEIPGARLVRSDDYLRIK